LESSFKQEKINRVADVRR